MKSAPVGVIAKVLRVLELLDQSPDGLSLKEVAVRARINKSTAHRFLSHLEGAGYLLRNISGVYMISPKLSRLGAGASMHSTLCKICRPALENLRRVTTETANLAVLDGYEVLYIDILETSHTFRLVSQIGMRRPFYCTSLGKAIVANMDEQAQENLFASVALRQVTPSTVTSFGQLRQQCTHIQKQGYSMEEEEAVIGVRCLGAVIRGADGVVVGAISVSGPTARIRNENLNFFAKELCKAAKEISWRLGYRAKKDKSVRALLA
jgi:DNA-binding IclR family transcriptional regulator